MLEGAVIKQTQVFVIPERVGNLPRRARKIFFAPTLAALEDTDRTTGLGQAASVDCSAKTGANHYHVVDIFHWFL
jgi:hypothetical protein